MPVYFLQAELNMEAMVMDEMLKAIIKEKTLSNLTHSNPSWLEPWLRRLRISKRSKGLYRSARLLDFHTVPWKSMRGSSESRSRKETISAVITEYCSILRYRVSLLRKEGSASGFIRWMLESVVSFAIEDDKGRPAPPGDRDPTSRKLSWPDDISFDSVSSSALTFDIVEENLSAIRALSRKRDKDAINKAIAALKACPAGWNITSDTFSSSGNNDESKKSTGVIPEISDAISVIAKVSLIFFSFKFV